MHRADKIGWIGTFFSVSSIFCYAAYGAITARGLLADGKRLLGLADSLHVATELVAVAGVIFGMWSYSIARRQAGRLVICKVAVYLGIVGLLLGLISV